MARTRQVKESPPERLRLRSAASIMDELNEMREQVTRRAYEIFDGRGGFGGSEVDDWLQAERELTWRPSIELAEQDGSLRLEAAVAGFEPGDLDVRITPEDILIRSEKVHDGETRRGNVYCSDFNQGRLFCEVRLPKAVDPKKAAAEYRNGLLKITAPIVETSHKETKVEIAGS